jgi:hypothetical protein
MEEPKQSHRTAIIVALITAASVLGAAIIGPMVAGRTASEPRPSNTRSATKVNQDETDQRDYGFAGSFGTYIKLEKSVMLQEGPSFDAEPLTMLRPGTVIAVTNDRIEGDVGGDGIYWVPIKTEDGWRGWLIEEDLD